MKTFLILDTVIKVPVYGMQTHAHLRYVRRIHGDIAVSGSQTTVDLDELLNRIPRNKNEETVMRCILEGGYSLRDMAEMCSLERARISQIKQSLLDRIHTVFRNEELV